MRYFLTDSTDFQRAVKPTEIFSLKDALEVPDPTELTSGGDYKLSGEETIDVVTNRLFGPDSETLWFILFNYNLEHFLGWRLEGEHLYKITIPSNDLIE